MILWTVNAKETGPTCKDKTSAKKHMCSEQLRQIEMDQRSKC